VPFGPTVTAAQLGSGPHLTDGFAGPVPGSLTGHLDLTLSALSPLFIGDSGQSGRSFRWPDGTPGIPGSTLHGVLRGVLAHLLGGGIGAAQDRRIYFRTPVADDHELVQHYRNRRSATAMPGRQRIGFLRRHGGRYEIDECTQLRPRPPQAAKNRAPFNQVPRVRWEVLGQDMGLTLTDGTPDHDAVSKHQWRRIWVVWASIATQKDGGASRPVVIGVGSSSEDAAKNAGGRAAGELASTVPSTVPQPQFLHYLPPGTDPTPVEMVLCATGLDGVNTKSAYLFPLPDSAAETVLFDTDAQDYFPSRITDPVPVAAEAVSDLLHPDQVTHYQTDNWPDMDDFLAGDGVPVFFDEQNGVAVRIGRSGGFRILAKRTLHETLPRNAVDAVHELTAIEALFGRIGADDASPGVTGRLAVGHAHADGPGHELIPADETKRRVALLAPQPKAYHLRLQAAPTRPDAVPATGFDTETATYRGREVYHHRWSAAYQADSASGWEQAGDAHAGIRPAGAEDPRANEKVSRPVLPLRPDLTFTARIRFTNLSRAELGAVLFALRLGNTIGADGSTGRDFAHRMGGLKPLGLGSVHIDARAHVTAPDRYADWDVPATRPLGVVDSQAFVEEFLAAIGAAETDRSPDWVCIEETGRAWPRHLAALLLAARWTRQLPLEMTREMPVGEHKHRVAPRTVFQLHGL
jgi:CRISPR-associated protein (TIGR03986 family)